MSHTQTNTHTHTHTHTHTYTTQKLILILSPMKFYNKLRAYFFTTPYMQQSISDTFNFCCNLPLYVFPSFFLSFFPSFLLLYSKIKSELCSIKLWAPGRYNYKIKDKIIHILKHVKFFKLMSDFGNLFINYTYNLWAFWIEIVIFSNII